MNEKECKCCRAMKDKSFTIYSFGEEYWMYGDAVGCDIRVFYCPVCGCELD